MRKSALLLSVIAASLFAASSDTSDICYDKMQTSGLFCVGIGPCAGGIGCKKIYPIRNVGDSALENVQIFYDESGLGGTFGNDCGVDPSGTCKSTSNVNLGVIGLLGQATEFDFADPITTDENADIWVKNFVSGSCFYGSNLYVRYYKNGILHEGKLQPCNNNIQGYFDAWDDDSSHGLNDKNITTKVVNEPFTLRIASVTKDGKGYELKTSLQSSGTLTANQVTTTAQNGPVDVRFAIENMDTGEYLTPWYTFIASQSPYISYTFVVNEASRNSRVIFKACADYDGTDYKFAPYEACAANGDCATNTDENVLCYRYFQSSDNFAIRPYGFRAFGTNQYKKAGESFDVEIKAVDKTGYDLNQGKVDNVIAVKGFNYPVSSLNVSASFYVPTDDEVKQMYKDVFYQEPTDINAARAKVAYCPDSGVFTTDTSKNFENGDVNATFTYNESGILTLKISEKPGYEFAKVDEDDTPDAQRFMKPAEVLTDREDLNKTDLLVFIPYQFVTTGSVSTTTGANWLYMSNEPLNAHNEYRLPLMAEKISYVVKAEDKNGNVLKNYTATCFPDVSTEAPTRNGLKLNTTFDLFLDSTMKADRDVTAQFDVVANNTTLWLYKGEYNLTSSKVNAREWLSPLAFNEGVANADVYMNIGKKYNTPMAPVNVEVVDINTSTSWMDRPDGTNIFKGSAINKSVEFRYGLVKIPDVTSTSNEAKVKATYLYFNNNETWVVNSDHTSDVFGSISKDSTKFISVPKVNISSIGDVSNATQIVVFTPAKGVAYSAKVHYPISPWLWYNPLAKDYKAPSPTNLDCLTHPCNSVSFLGNGGGWAGVGKESQKYSEQNKTIKAPATKAGGNVNEFNRVNW
jgi:hypothetical protein